MKEIDAQHQSLYTSEAGHYDARRFSSRRGQLCHHYEQRSLIRLLSPLKGTRVLDVPAGTGRIAEALMAAGADVVAADLTSAMLSVARQKILDARGNALSRGRFCPVNANGRQLPFPEASFDRVISVRFLHLIPPDDWPGFLSEMRRVTKPGGHLVVQIFNPLFGGPLALLRQLHRRARAQPGEQFVWPHKIRSIFSAGGLEVLSVGSYWLPGMAFLGAPGTTLLDRLSRACEKTPLKWIAGPHHVLARPKHR